MSKMWLIIKREYLIRVRKKSFLITTILTPLAIGLLAVISAYFASQSGNEKLDVIVKDESGILAKHPPQSNIYTYQLSESSLEELKLSYSERGHDLLLHIPSFESLEKTLHSVSYFSKEKLSLNKISGIEKHLSRSFKEYKIDKSNIDKSIYESFKTDIEMENGALSETDPENSQNDTTGKLSVIIGTVIGGIMGVLMYIVIFMYGGMVMRSVMEEKINRVVEVMVSSVKPTQLMLGKIFGVGAVGLTQLTIWMVLIPIILVITQGVFGPSHDPQQLQEMATQMQGIPSQEFDSYDIKSIAFAIGQLNWIMIIPVFIIFFFGGYFIYSSLFAAVGSAISDDMGESQQLMLPIMLPVIVAFFMLQAIIQSPNSNMAIFGSLFPLFSPIIMPARLAFDPPLWQIVLSIVILIISCFFFAWLAGRIYRVGILMYGKKVSFKEIGKWLFYKA